MYFLQTNDGETIYKVKGLSHDIELTLTDFENLLFKESSIQKIQNKWIKNLSEGYVSILDQLYTLQIIKNKRDLSNKNSELFRLKYFVLKPLKILWVYRLLTLL